MEMRRAEPAKKQWVITRRKHSKNEKANQHPIIKIVDIFTMSLFHYYEFMAWSYRAAAAYLIDWSQRRGDVNFPDHCAYECESPQQRGQVRAHRTKTPRILSLNCELIVAAMWHLKTGGGLWHLSLVDVSLRFSPFV